MTLYKQKIRHFDPSKTVSHLSSSVLIPKHYEENSYLKNRENLESTEKNLLSISQSPADILNQEKQIACERTQKQNDEFIQNIIEGNREYFNHLKGNCACGQCICGKCKCEISHLPKLTSVPSKSSYQNQFKFSIPYENNKLDYTLTYPPGINMNKRPIDEQYKSISKVYSFFNNALKSDYKQPLAVPFEIFKTPHPLLQNEELFGETTYMHNFKKQSPERTPMLFPIGYTKVLTKLPFDGRSLYQQEYDKHYALGKDLKLSKIIIDKYNNFKILSRSPMSPQKFPFLGSTTNRQAFQATTFRYPQLKVQKQLLEIQYPQYLWKSINSTDFQNKGAIDCPGRQFIMQKPHI